MEGTNTNGTTTNKEFDNQTTDTTGTNTTGTTTTETTTAGSTSTKTDTKRKSKRTTKDKDKSNENNNELPILEVTVPKSEQPTEPPKEKKVKNPRNAGRKPKVQKKQTDSRTIEMLLATVSGILSSRKNMEVFALSDEEIKAIAQPLSNILDKYDGVSKLQSEYTDHILLVTAIVTIMLPKVLIYQSINKNKNTNKAQNISKKEGVINERTINDSSQSATGTSGHTNISKTDRVNIHNIIPTTI